MFQLIMKREIYWYLWERITSDFNIDNNDFSDFKSVKTLIKFKTKKSNFFSNFAFLIHLSKNENKILGTY